MYKRKIAIYVEGRTEQQVLNHFIKIWYNYENIEITNLKILSGQNQKCEVVNFRESTTSVIQFLILDVNGEGSLPSAIADRSKKQLEAGFKIFSLRDLYSQDFQKLPKNIDSQSAIKKSMKISLEKKGCNTLDDIHIFFAVMEIEAWLLAFPSAVSKWAKVDESEVLKLIEPNHKNIENIKRPSVIFSEIGKLGGNKGPKSIGTITKVLNGISLEDLQNVYHSKLLPNFNKFWDELTDHIK